MVTFPGDVVFYIHVVNLASLYSFVCIVLYVSLNDFAGNQGKHGNNLAETSLSPLLGLVPTF